MTGNIEILFTMGVNELDLISVQAVHGNEVPDEHSVRTVLFIYLKYQGQRITNLEIFMVKLFPFTKFQKESVILFLKQSLNLAQQKLIIYFQDWSSLIARSIRLSLCICVSLFARYLSKLISDHNSSQALVIV